MKPVVMVAAVADNGVIGHAGGVPWHLSEDLRHFRATTTGHTVVMGRTTYEGIGHPLPYRTNLVVTRDPDWRAEGVLVAHSVEAALDLAQRLEGDVMIGGGAQVYRAAMPFATHQVLTEVHQRPEGDTHYPGFDRSQWRETRREAREGFDWVWLERTHPESSAVAPRG
jgi:dihydrofolate reductase